LTAGIDSIGASAEDIISDYNVKTHWQSWRGGGSDFWGLLSLADALCSPALIMLNFVSSSRWHRGSDARA